MPANAGQEHVARGGAHFLWFHEWSKWQPLDAVAHAYQHRTCLVCGMRQYRTVGLG